MPFESSRCVTFGEVNVADPFQLQLFFAFRPVARRHGSQVVEYLLEEGTDLKWTNNKGSTLLHFLAYSPMSEGDKEAVGKKFIAGGVDVDASVCAPKKLKAVQHFELSGNNKVDEILVYVIRCR